MEKRPFFRADMAGLGKYHMGGYGRIGVYRVNKISMYNKEISNVSHYKYLGMILDDKLTMKEYLDVVWKKTNA